MIVSGEAASTELLRQARVHFGVPVHSQYGQTESAEAAVWDGHGEGEPGASLLGRPVGAYSLYVVDPALHPVPRTSPVSSASRDQAAWCGAISINPSAPRSGSSRIPIQASRGSASTARATWPESVVAGSSSTWEGWTTSSRSEAAASSPARSRTSSARTGTCRGALWWVAPQSMVRSWSPMHSSGGRCAVTQVTG